MLQSRQRSMIKRARNPEEQRPEVMNLCFGYKRSITSSTMFSSPLVNTTIWCPATWSMTSHGPRSNRWYTFKFYFDLSLNSIITLNHSILENLFDKCDHQVVPITCNSCSSYPAVFTHIMLQRKRRNLQLVPDKIIKTVTQEMYWPFSCCCYKFIKAKLKKTIFHFFSKKS